MKSSFFSFLSKVSDNENSRENANLSDPSTSGNGLAARENESGDGRLEGEDRKALLLKHGDSFSGKKKERQSSTTF